MNIKSTYANRGMGFEHLIEITNKQYFDKGRATIQKVATPWQVIRKGKEIVSAFPKEKSTVDFIGIVNGRGIAFDAKSTRVTTRFDLSLVEDHQFQFLKKWKNNGGISFILVEFAKKREVYVLSINQLMDWEEISKDGGRKSIPYDYFLANCDIVKSKNGILLDYLSVIDTQ